MGKLLLATNNPGKLHELKALLGDLGLDLLTPRELDLDLEVVEDGATYAENAAIKALAFSKAAGLIALADDSGLEVEVLDGAPGLRSARYSPRPGATDADRRALMLQNLRGHPHPWTARFRCAIAVVKLEGVVQYAEGICEGQIIPQERGDNGFGYDPIFLLPESGLTMAELEDGEKNRISHRALAAMAARPILAALFRL